MAIEQQRSPAQARGRWWPSAAVGIVGFAMLSAGFQYFVGGTYTVAWALACVGILLLIRASVLGYRAYMRRSAERTSIPPRP